MQRASEGPNFLDKASGIVSTALHNTTMFQSDALAKYVYRTGAVETHLEAYDKNTNALGRLVAWRRIRVGPHEGEKN